MPAPFPLPEPLWEGTPATFPSPIHRPPTPCLPHLQTCANSQMTELPILSFIAGTCHLRLSRLCGTWTDSGILFSAHIWTANPDHPVGPVCEVDRRSSLPTQLGQEPDRTGGELPRLCVAYPTMCLPCHASRTFTCETTTAVYTCQHLPHYCPSFTPVHTFFPCSPSYSEPCRQDYLAVSVVLLLLPQFTTTAHLFLVGHLCR